MNSIEVSGKTVDQAIEIGLFKLNAKREDVTVIVLEEGGLFDKAKVRLILTSEFENQTEVEKVVTNFCAATGLKIFGTVEESDKEIKINFTGEDVGSIIGKRGDCLDATQFLMSQIINKNKPNKEYKRVIIDSEGYRGKREESLRALARKLASKAVKEGKIQKLEPMNAYERKIIHLALEGREDVTTVSKNEEPHRYITIIPNNKSMKVTAEEKTSVETSNARDFND